MTIITAVVEPPRTPPSSRVCCILAMDRGRLTSRVANQDRRRACRSRSAARAASAYTLDARNVIRQFHQLRAQADLPQLRFHDLWRSAATLLRSQGEDLTTIQAILAHGSYEITADFYTHVLLSVQERAVDRLHQLLAE